MKRDAFRLNVGSKFKFMEEDFGFTLTTSNAATDDFDTESVVFEHPGSRVIVQCSIRDGWGLDVLLERAEFGEFSYHTYLRLVAPEIACRLGLSLAASDAELFELIALYSSSLKEYGLGLLAGDSYEWNRLKRAEELGEGVAESFDASDRFCEAAENPTWE